MKRSCRSLLCAVLLGSAVVPAVAQVAPTPPIAAPASIPQTVKTATNLSTGDRTTITNFINGNVQRLMSDTPATVSAAREALINEIPVDNNRKGSPTFLDFYAETLNSSLVKSIGKAEPLSRLNAAIVVARVAEPADTSQLREIATRFVSDDYQPVVLWGMRAAKYILPSIVRNPVLATDVALRNALPSAVKKHTKGVLAGDIAREAYEALTLDAFNPKPRFQISKEMISGVIPQLHQLMRFRVDEYRQGIPASPLAELNGVNFLLERNRWAAQTAEQRLTSVQLFSDLLSLAAQQAAAANNKALQTDVVRVVDLVAGAISILGAYPDVNAPAVTAAADAVLDKGVAVTAKPQLAQAVFPALKAIKEFSALKAPPQVTGNAEPETEPTTVPTTTTAPAATPATAPAAAAPAAAR